MSEYDYGAPRRGKGYSTSYRHDEVKRVLDNGPNQGEDFYRLQIRGQNQTRWLNISHEEADMIAALLDERDNS